MIPPRRWRSIGGPQNPGEPPEPRVWIDAGSGPGIEVPRKDARRFVMPPFPTGTLSGPAAKKTPRPPARVQLDAVQMTLAMHEPASDTHCMCGGALGEDTGLCWYGRQAQKGLMELQAEQREQEQRGDA